MSLRQSEITATLTRWLDRYSCPMNLRDKPQAAQAEAEALAGVLLRFAPQTEYQPFMNRVFSQLDYQMKTRAWPTVAEVSAVCSSVRKAAAIASGTADSEKDMRPVAIAARAMAEGKPVGEGWLYGRMAVEMIAERLVDKTTMDKYRSGAFLHRKAVYGEPAALAWETEAKARHEDAKHIFRETPSTGHDTTAPDKRVLQDFAA